MNCPIVFTINHNLRIFDVLSAVDALSRRGTVYPDSLIVPRGWWESLNDSLSIGGLSEPPKNTLLHLWSHGGAFVAGLASECPPRRAFFTKEGYGVCGVIEGVEE